MNLLIDIIIVGHSISIKSISIFVIKPFMNITMKTFKYININKIYTCQSVL